MVVAMAVAECNTKQYVLEQVLRKWKSCTIGLHPLTVNEDLTMLCLQH